MPGTTRRLVAVGAGILLLLATFAAPAVATGSPHGGGGPIVGRGGISFDYQFAAGDLCPFAVHWVEDGSRMVSLTFPVQRNGDQLIVYAGPQWSTVTNTTSASAPSMVVGGGLLMNMLVHPDGSADVRVTGTVVAGYLPTDAPGAGFWVLHGRVHDTWAADGSTTSHSFKGRAVDLCAALAG